VTPSKLDLKELLEDGHHARASVLDACNAAARGGVELAAVVWRARSRHTMEGHGGGGPGVVPRGGGEESRDHER
jgi:hypothetical protein